MPKEKESEKEKPELGIIRCPARLVGGKEIDAATWYPVVVTDSGRDKGLLIPLPPSCTDEEIRQIYDEARRIAVKP